MAPSLTENAPISSTEPHAKTNGALSGQKRHEEYQYLDLVREILETGEHRPDRCAPAVGGSGRWILLTRPRGMAEQERGPTVSLRRSRSNSPSTATAPLSSPSTRPSTTNNKPKSPSCSGSSRATRHP